MGRRSKGKKEEFNPFIDILTCLAGVMVLLIITVVIDAKDPKILVPMPIMRDSTLQPVYIEVNKEGLFFPIPLDELNNLVRAKLGEAVSQSKGDHLKMLSILNSMDVQTDMYKVDMGYAMMQNLVVTPVGNSEGFSIDAKTKAFGSADWFEELLSGVNKSTHMLVFIVRSTDESYKAFKKARAIAWGHSTKVGYEVIDNREPIKFGFGGGWTPSQ